MVVHGDKNQMKPWLINRIFLKGGKQPSLMTFFLETICFHLSIVLQKHVILQSTIFPFRTKVELPLPVYDCDFQIGFHFIGHKILTLRFKYEVCCKKCIHKRECSNMLRILVIQNNNLIKILMKFDDNIIP